MLKMKWGGRAARVPCCSSAAVRAACSTEEEMQTYAECPSEREERRAAGSCSSPLQAAKKLGAPEGPFYYYYLYYLLFLLFF